MVTESTVARDKHEHGHSQRSMVAISASKTMETDVPALEVSDLRVVHPRMWSRKGGFVAVDGVTVVVKTGEIVGLVGESGSGKTTVAMAAAGLGRVSSGSISVSGASANPRSWWRRDFRAQVQVVFQDPHGSLDPRQTVRSGFRELRRLHPKRTAWIGDEALLGKVQLAPDLLDRLPNEISGGQAQRVSIARALLLRPSVLVADEPTSALDVSVQAQIIELLHALSRDEGLAILFISHDLSVVRHLCRRIYVMRAGVVVEQGDMEAVATTPRHEYTRRLIDALPGSVFSEYRSGVRSSAAQPANATSAGVS